MELAKEDLPYFVPFVLLDQASRIPSLRKQTLPMKGFWMARSTAAGIRESDGRLRRHACMDALRHIGGMPGTKAACEVALILGRPTAQWINVIRADYYQRRQDGAAARDSFFFQFLHWRAWVFELGDEEVESTLHDYGRQFGLARRRSLAQLFARLREDPVQQRRNRSWILEPGERQRNRIESKFWDPNKDWQLLATDLWVLGRLHFEIGEAMEASTLLDQALDIWKTHGHRLPHLQTTSIPALEWELSIIAEYIPNRKN